MGKKPTAVGGPRACGKVPFRAKKQRGKGREPKAQSNDVKDEPPSNEGKRKGGCFNKHQLVVGKWTWLREKKPEKKKLNDRVCGAGRQK